MRLLLFVLLCIFGWFSSKPFEVVEKTSQTSMGGRAESGIATSYTIKIVAAYGSDQLIISDLWVDTNYFPVQPYKQKSDLSFSQTWEKGDTLYIKAVKNSYPDGGKMVREIPVPVKPVPKKFAGAALIGYKLKGKEKYFEIDAFRELPTQYNP